MPSPKRPITAATERDGVNFVRSVVEGANCIFHEIHRDNDYGNDAFLEIVDDECVTGICVVLQIKSGQSYCLAESCSIPTTPKQRNYWSGHKLPVVGVVYDPSEEVGYWVDISRRLHGGAEGAIGHFVFPKSRLSRFDAEGFRTFFLPMFLNKAIRLDLKQSREFAFSDSFEMHSIGVRSLFYGFRNDERTWALFEELLRNRPSEQTTGYLAYIFAHVPGHGDIMGHKDSILDNELMESLRKRFSDYDRDLLLPLIRLIDDGGFGRGTVGQNVYAVVDLAIAEPGLKLEALILDESLEAEVRISALSLFCLVEQERAEPLLVRFAVEPSDVGTHAAELLGHLRAVGFFHPG